MPGAFVSWNRLSHADVIVPERVHLKLGDIRSCHDNVVKMFHQNLVDEAWAGYALSDDGLWRFHSWGRSAQGWIETTDLRCAYWGVAYMKRPV